TRQIGKSSLVVRAANRLRSSGYSVAIVDLTSIGQNLIPEQWCFSLFFRIAEQLGEEEAAHEFWRANNLLSPIRRLFAGIERLTLSEYAPTTGTILIFDEIDSVRSLPFATDEFFAGIRECYNRRAEDPRFRRLVFCLLGVAAPSDLIRDTRTTPFNI